MYTVRARALQSAVAVPATARVCSRQHARRQGHASSGPITSTVLRGRSLHSSARLLAPEGSGDNGKDGKDGQSATTSPESSTTATGSGESTAADAAPELKENQASPAAPASSSTTSTYSGGRTRGIRSRATDGTPPYTLPGWFKDHHVRFYDKRANADSLLSTTLDEDVTHAAFLFYPRNAAKFSTEPEWSTLPIPYTPYESVGNDVGPEGKAKYVSLKDHDRIYGYLESILEGSEWTEDKVELAHEQMRLGTGLDAIVRRGASVAAAARYLAVAYASRPAETKTIASKDTEDAKNLKTPESLSKSRENLEKFESTPLYKFFDNLGVVENMFIQRHLFAAHMIEFLRMTYSTTSAEYLKDEADISVQLGIPISTKFYERAMFRDLQSTVATGLLLPPPDAKAVRRDWRRPVTVVTMMQHSSQTMTEGLLDEIALSLSARIVHIDAKTIASVAGPYLGQSPWLSRGTIAMLGYTVARINGRLLPRYPKNIDGDEGSGADAEAAAGGENVNEFVYSRDGDEESGHAGSDGDISLSLSRLPADFMSTSRSALRSDADDRWDDLKMNHVLEAIVRSADDEAVKASKTANATGTAKPPVIIHLHNFVELSSNFDGNQILYKLRGIVDKLWLKERRRVLLVGSTNISHKQDAPDLIDRAEELRQEDCDIFPYQLQLDHPGYITRMKKASQCDVLAENVHNIVEMVSALTSTCIVAQGKFLAKELTVPHDIWGRTHYYHPNLRPVIESLRSGVYDIHRVYRIAMLWISIVKGNLMHQIYPGWGVSPPWTENDIDCRSTYYKMFRESDRPDPFDSFSEEAVRADQLISKDKSLTFFNHIQDNATALASPTSASTSPADFGEEETFIHACWTVAKFDQLWREQGGAKGNYSSPLLIKRYRDGKKHNLRDLWWWKSPAEREKIESLAREKDEETAKNEKDEDGSSYATPGDATVPNTPRPAKPDYKRFKFNQYEQRLVQDIVDPAEITTTFDTIVLPAKTKEAIQSLTTLTLLRPDAFSYGVLAAEHIPGCLLYGPPGTGKTLLAKAVAKQSGFKMLEVSGASMNGKYVGETEKNIRAAFTVARTLAPSVLFIDEADALLGSRNGESSRTGHAEKVNQFLREIDGLKPSTSGNHDADVESKSNKHKGRVFLMVATNRPGDIDEAVLRRLPRRILVDLPERDARLAILRVMLRHEQLDAGLSLEKIADGTELYSGSDLKNVCVAAAMRAVRDEMEAMEAYKKTEKDQEYVFPARRTLTARHFELALQEISASISENMASLKAIRKFDEQYGDSGARKRKKKQSGMGFEVVPRQVGTKDAMVRRE